MTNPIDLITKARLVELTQTLVSIPSVTGQEQKLADWIYHHFQTIGLSNVQRLPVDEAADTVVGWIDGPSDGPAMMLNFHLDTFDVFEGWETDPFTPHLAEGKLYGLGAHDMKGGAACVLGAVEALLQAQVSLGGRLLVTATTDEENWSRGAHALINSGLLAGCRYCLVPEPSAPGTLTIGQRGRHVFHLTFYGKTVHAAYEGGINAVTEAAKVVERLSRLEGIDLGYNPMFNLSGSLCVIGFHGGGTLILVPEQADVFIDRHLLPGQQVEEAAAQLRQVIEEAGLKGSYRLTWDERPTPAPPPFIFPPDSPFVQTVKAHLAQTFSRDIKFVLGRSVADTNHFAAHGGVPTLICGPHGGNTCQANEYVEVDSLLPVAQTYLKSVLDLLPR
jgi:succinyl-diaminopimelate desuccinylase